MTTQRTRPRTHKRNDQTICTCTPTMRQAHIAVIDCPAHGLAAFCRTTLAKGSAGNLRRDWAQAKDDGLVTR